jgi:hypothetical protein
MLTMLGFEFAGNALLNSSVIINGYVLPGMKHFTPETCQFNILVVEKDEIDAVKG